MTTVDEIADLTLQIKTLQDQRRALLQAWAAEVSPYKVGDVATIQGYSFQGKQARVLAIEGLLNYQKKPCVDNQGSGA